MSIFGSIMSKVFHSGQAQASPAATTAQASPATAASTPQASAAAGSASPAAKTEPPVASPQPAVDVEAVLTDLSRKAGQQLDWRHSIVDLMKLLDLDSSLSARKDLAKELHYSGDTSDSAGMNVWLHKQVMTKLAENGGKVPADLRT